MQTEVDSPGAASIEPDAPVIAPVAVHRLVHRIAEDHGGVRPEVISAAVADSLSRTAGARVHAFRLLLAERSTREWLARQSLSRVDA